DTCGADLTAEGWLCVAAVIDLFSRRVVGWSMNAALTAQLCGKHFRGRVVSLIPRITWQASPLLSQYHAATGPAPVPWRPSVPASPGGRRGRPAWHRPRR